MVSENTFPACISRCSRIAPKLSAGKNVSALTMSTTKTSRELNSGVVTGKVPADSGTNFLRARLPAMARIGITAKNRPNSVANPIVVLYQSVLPLNPANADPLFPVPDVYAYKTCDSPCGPGFEIEGVPNFAETTEIAVNVRITSGKISTDSMAIFTSYASIFFPKYSGVRPTINPAMNTARITNTIIPYSPEPTPPNTTSPSMMFTSGTMPPSGVNESCIAFTAPQLASVVTVAYNAEFVMPKRTSLPSMFPPGCCALAVWSTPSSRGSPRASAE